MTLKAEQSVNEGGRSMQRDILGMALILFGILLNLVEINGGIWLPIIGPLPLGAIGFLIGFLGIVLVIYTYMKK